MGGHALPFSEPGIPLPRRGVRTEALEKKRRPAPQQLSRARATVLLKLIAHGNDKNI